MTSPIPNVVSIAGSDPSGGAGIQADLKTFSALGTYGMAVLTALTAQNTRSVTGIHVPPAAFVEAEIAAILDDIRVDAVKIGMVANAEVADAIARRLEAATAPGGPIDRDSLVVDPVMVAKSGDRLLEEDAIAAVRDRLVPLAGLITPNLPEAAVLTGLSEPTDAEGMTAMAQALKTLGPGAVLLKGGHLGGRGSDDVFFDGQRLVRLHAPRIASRNTHGTGCTLSSAIAAMIPQSPNLETAVRRAKDYLTGAILAAERLAVGHGHGPTHHFHALWAAERPVAAAS